MLDIVNAYREYLAEEERFIAEIQHDRTHDRDDVTIMDTLTEDEENEALLELEGFDFDTEEENKAYDQWRLHGLRDALHFLKKHYHENDVSPS